MPVQVQIDMNFIRDFCRKWGVAKLALMGSAITGEFKEESDLDFLVTFGPKGWPPDIGFVEMKLELEEKFGRPVDLVDIETVKNPYKRKHMLEHHEVIYESE